MSDFVRSFPLEDFSIRSGGDGRTVEAYAAVFDVATRIADQDGQYMERIAPSAFNKTLQDNGNRFQVLFNHGLTIYGTPSDIGSMPVGKCEEVRADRRGLLTVTRYNQTPLGEQCLESWRSGSITAQSFQGRFIGSDMKTPKGGFRADPRTGALTTVTRTEIGLKEYGPAVFAAYPEANLVGIRAAAGALTLDTGQSALLGLILEQLAAADAQLDPIVEALCATDCALDSAQLVLAQILGVPNPDPMDGMDAADGGDRAVYAHLQTLATRLATATARNSSTSSDAADGTPVADHVARFLHLRAQARKIGALA